MAKILSNSFSTTTLASSLQHLIAFFRSTFSDFGARSAAGTRSLSSRLRYDLGELDINPDCIRAEDVSHRGNFEREVMRRSF